MSGSRWITCKSWSKIVTIYLGLSTISRHFYSRLTQRCLKWGLFILIFWYFNIYTTLYWWHCRHHNWKYFGLTLTTYHQGEARTLSVWSSERCVDSALALFVSSSSEMFYHYRNILQTEQIIFTWWVFDRREIWLIIFESIFPNIRPKQLRTAALACRKDLFSWNITISSCLSHHDGTPHIVELVLRGRQH